MFVIELQNLLQIYSGKYIFATKYIKHISILEYTNGTK